MTDLRSKKYSKVDGTSSVTTTYLNCPDVQECRHAGNNRRERDHEWIEFSVDGRRSMWLSTDSSTSNGMKQQSFRTPKQSSWDALKSVQTVKL